MRNRNKRTYSKAPGILAALLAFLVSLAFVSDPISPPEGYVGGSIGHEIGWPVFWMNVYTPGIAATVELLWRDSGAFDLLFNGNAGIVIHWLGLLVQVLLSLAIGVLVQLLVNGIRSKWGKPAPLEKTGFRKGLERVSHLLRASGWLTAAAYWVVSPFWLMGFQTGDPDIYHLGLGGWLTISSYYGKTNTWELFFRGNDGVTVQPVLFVLCYLLVGLALGGLVQYFVNWLRKRRHKTAFSGRKEAAS